MKDWNEVVLVPEFNEQGVACYRLDGGDYLNEYYIVSEAESRKLLNVPEVVGYEVYDCLIPSTSQMLYYLKEQKKVTYSAMVSCMDRGIGAIVDALKKKGIMDNTFFIFFSDNGTAGVPGSSSGPLRGHKFDEWDGGVHAPAVLYWKKAEKQYKNLSSQVTGFVDLVPTLKDLVGDHSRPKREYDGISILPVLNGKKACIDRDFYLGHGAVVNKDYKLIRKGMKPGLDLKQDFLVDYKTDPYEKKNASAGNEKIVKALYEVALKYDTITPCIPEVPYGKGRDGFKAPKEWKVVR